MLASNVAIRKNLEKTLKHVSSAFERLQQASGNGKPLHFPDLHKTTDGLFLSAWTYWEQFLRDAVAPTKARQAQ
jgi:hypothetical protein